MASPAPTLTAFRERLTSHISRLVDILGTRHAALGPELAGARSELEPNLPFAQLVELVGELKRDFYVEEDETELDEARRERLKKKREIRRHMAEFELKALVLRVGQSVRDDTSYLPVYDALDVMLAFEANKLCDSNLPLSSIEELLDIQTIEGTERIWEYIESRRERLTANMIPQQGKGLLLLRLSNELLRRLSKASHTAVCGRILMFLSSVFPLGERSGVNLRGNFNVENATEWEPADAEQKTSSEQGIEGAKGEADGEQQANDTSDQEAKAVDAQAKSGDKGDISAEGPNADVEEAIDGEFYDLFWSLQQVFSNPPILFTGPSSTSASGSRPASLAGTPTPQATGGGEEEGKHKTAPQTPFEEFQTKVIKTLQVFKRIGKKENELARGQKADRKEAIAGDKRKRDDVGEMEVDERSAEDVKKNYFYPKFLTSRKLLRYELKSAYFRRHILVQLLIVFQYLLSFTAADKAKAKDQKNKLLFRDWLMEDTSARWTRECWKEVLGLLREIPPNGPTFYMTVLQILRRERNWLMWKADACPSYERASLTTDRLTSVREAQDELFAPVAPYPHSVGTAALSELWEEGWKGLEELEEPPRVPEVAWYAKRIRAEDIRGKSRLKRAREEGAEADRVEEETEETKQSLSWRALRIASRTHVHLFSKIGTGDVDLLVKEIEEEKKPKPPKTSPATVTVVSQEVNATTVSPEVDATTVSPSAPAANTNASDSQTPVPSSTEEGTSEALPKDVEMTQAEGAQVEGSV